MAQLIRKDNIPVIVKASGTSITLAATHLGQATLITIAGQQYPVTSLLTLNTGTVGAGGLDTGSLAASTLYYVYAVLSSNIPALIASTAAPSVGPTGFTSAFKNIGMFSTDTVPNVNVVCGIDLAQLGTLTETTQTIFGAKTFMVGALQAGDFDATGKWRLGPPTLAINPTLVHNIYGNVTLGTVGSKLLVMGNDLGNFGQGLEVTRDLNNLTQRINISMNSGGATFVAQEGSSYGIYLFKQFDNTNTRTMAQSDTAGAWTFGSGSAPFTTGTHVIHSQISSGANCLLVRNNDGGSGGDSSAALGVSKVHPGTTSANVFIRFYASNTAQAMGSITGNGANSATFTNTSDRRLKENIVDLGSQLNKIMALRPVEFDYKNLPQHGVSGGHQIGYVAQELMEIYPDAVSENDKGFLSVSGWDKTSARLVKAIQELKAEKDALEARVAELEK